MGNGAYKSPMAATGTLTNTHIPYPGLPNTTIVITSKNVYNGAK